MRAIYHTYHFVEVRLHKEHGVKVKYIFPWGLMKYAKLIDIPLGQQNDVLTGFLERDYTHLNYWGYRALLNELIIPIMDAKATSVCM